MANEKKKVEPKPRPEKYEKSQLAIKGSFDDAMKVFFLKPDKENIKTAKDNKDEQ